MMYMHLLQIGCYKKNKSNCQESLRTWNHETFGLVQNTLAKKLKELSRAEKASLYTTTPDQIYKLCEEIELLKSKEETMWKQRSHANWLKDVDRNTRYFHYRANQRNKYNLILGLGDEFGLWVEDENQMDKMVEEYFLDIFTTTNPHRF